MVYQTSSSVGCLYSRTSLCVPAVRPLSDDDVFDSVDLLNRARAMSFGNDNMFAGFEHWLSNQSTSGGQLPTAPAVNIEDSHPAAASSSVHVPPVTNTLTNAADATSDLCTSDNTTHVADSGPASSFANATDNGASADGPTSNTTAAANAPFVATSNTFPTSFPGHDFPLLPSTAANIPQSGNLDLGAFDTFPALSVEAAKELDNAFKNAPFNLSDFLSLSPNLQGVNFPASPSQTPDNEDVDGEEEEEEEEEEGEEDECRNGVCSPTSNFGERSQATMPLQVGYQMPYPYPRPLHPGSTRFPHPYNFPSDTRVHPSMPSMPQVPMMPRQPVAFGPYASPPIQQMVPQYPPMPHNPYAMMPSQHPSYYPMGNPMAYPPNYPPGNLAASTPYGTVMAEQYQRLQSSPRRNNGTKPVSRAASLKASASHAIHSKVKRSSSQKGPTYHQIYLPDETVKKTPTKKRRFPNPAKKLKQAIR